MLDVHDHLEQGSLETFGQILHFEPPGESHVLCLGNSFLMSFSQFCLVLRPSGGGTELSTALFTESPGPGLWQFSSLIEVLTLPSV